MKQGKELEDRFSAAGGVSQRVVEAFRSVLKDGQLDGAFAAAAVTLPSASELYSALPEANPVLLHNARSALCV